MYGMMMKMSSMSTGLGSTASTAGTSSETIDKLRKRLAMIETDISQKDDEMLAQEKQLLELTDNL